jgi:hypothetical protein
MTKGHITADKERIKKHKARKADLAELAVAVAKEKAATEAYDAEDKQWLLLPPMEGEIHWIHLDTLTEFRDRYTWGKPEMTCVPRKRCFQ